MVQSRISDPRAVQFWDKDHVVARELRHQLSSSQPSCCQRSGNLWDVVALYPRKVQWGGSPPVFIDGPVRDAAPELSNILDGLTL